MYVLIEYDRFHYIGSMTFCLHVGMMGFSQSDETILQVSFPDDFQNNDNIQFNPRDPKSTTIHVGKLNGEDDQYHLPEKAIDLQHEKGSEKSGTTPAFRTPALQPKSTINGKTPTRPPSSTPAKSTRKPTPDQVWS